MAKASVQSGGRTAKAGPATGPTRTASKEPNPQHQQSRAGRASSLLVQDEKSQLPAYLQDYVGKGMEGMGQEDLARPRLKLLQALSPELETYNKARPGGFLHTASGEILHGPFLATPIFVAKRYLLWNPRESGGGILARSDDGVTWSPSNAKFDVKLDKKDGGAHVTWETAPTVRESGLGEWGTQNPTDPNSPPAATKLYDYVFGFPEYPDLEPAVFSFQRSSWKVGRNLNTNIKTAIARRPMFTLAYTIDSVDDQNSISQDFKNIIAMPAGVLGDNDLIELYRQHFDALSTTGLKIKDEESLQDEADRMGSEEPEKPSSNPNMRGGRSGKRFPRP